MIKNKPDYRENMTTRIRPELKKALKVLAASQDCSLSDVLEQAALLYLKSVKSAS
jgi:predicted HicB family RNase H-like nuclease